MQGNIAAEEVPPHGLISLRPKGAKVSHKTMASDTLARPVIRLGAIQEHTMPIDPSVVDWQYVGILSGFAFVASLIGSLLSFRSRLIGAILAGILFAAAFVFWTYYPHDNIPGPTSLRVMKPPVTSPK
jgi:hypothetical protein